MNSIVFFLIFIFILLIIYFFILKKENNKINKDFNIVLKNDFNNNHYDFDEFHYNNGYQNELMYSNNLKDGDYTNLFEETEINKDVINNNQIGFNPSPRKQMKTLPYVNIHSKCL